MTFFRQKCVFVLMTAVAVSAAGCSSSKSEPGIFPVQGQVLVKGKPAAYAKVTFVPADNAQKEFSAYAEANENGEFHLSTRKPRDGAKPGKYNIAISWRIPDNPRSSDDRQYSNELLPRKFQDSEKSGVEMEIRPNESQLRPIELNSD